MFFFLFLLNLKFTSRKWAPVRAEVELKNLSKKFFNFLIIFNSIYLKYTVRRFLEKKILERFGVKLFLQKIFKRSSNNFFLYSFWDLWKIFSSNLIGIFSSNLLEIFGRSSVQIFLRFTWDLLVLVLILRKMVRRSSNKIFLWRSQKELLMRSS